MQIQLIFDPAPLCHSRNAILLTSVQSPSLNGAIYEYYGRKESQTIFNKQTKN
jgi:hypothetical protein